VHHVCMRVTTTGSFVVWITRGLNPVGPLTKTVRGNIRDTDIVLRVPWDSVNPTNKGLRALLDHMEDSYDCYIIYLLYIFLTVRFCVDRW
jgi:hypothetical protein